MTGTMLYRRDFVYPPIDGTIALPDTLDFHEKHNADLPMFVFNEEGAADITEITYLEFSRACQRVAHLVRPGRAGPDGEIVAFIALTDAVLYQAISVGLMRAGLVPFPISPRNTPAAVAHLLKKTSCHRLITTPVTLKSLLDGLKAELSDSKYELNIEQIPSLSDAYPRLGFEKQDDPFDPYPCSPRPTSLKDLALYLHSSGSTGFPKPIAQTHEIMVHWAAFPSTPNFRDNVPRMRWAGMHLPPFHTLGIYAQVLWTLYGCMTIAVYPPTTKTPEALPTMPSPENILDHARRTKSNGTITIPSLIQIWAQDPGHVETLRNFEFVSYSGGSLAPKVGDSLAESGVRLSPGYGGTEFGSPTIPTGLREDLKGWMWMQFDHRCNVRWVAQGDGTYECQFLTTATHSLPIENLPDVRGYATSDLWEPHPTKPDLWKIVGRIDDVIIHSSGEKTVPPPMEDIVMSSPYVMGTVMFGREHDQAGILIEPKPEFAIDVDDQNALQDLRNRLWSTIEDANAVAPSFSRIFKEMILITRRNKALPRTPKGTVMRKLALSTYEEEIEALYQTVESFGTPESIRPPKSWTAQHIRQWISLQVEDLNKTQRPSPSADLFDQGFDSLSATILRRRISSALQSSKEPLAKVAASSITQNTIYKYPTINKLTEHIAGLFSGSQVQEPLDDHVAGIEEMISKYSSNSGAAVLLTGSTGNLGAQILESLLSDDRVETIYVMNRPSRDDRTLLERHQDRFSDKGLDVELLNSYKLVFLEGDTSKRFFGLAPRSYEELRDSVNIIVHSAWRLDFNLSLSSFEPQIRGTRNLVEFARSTPKKEDIKILFTSSIASALSWDPRRGPYPEEVVHDSRFSVGNGYGESKYVSERILANSGLQVCSLRLGQICGGYPNGAWATTDWVPIMVKSSLKIGALPDAVGLLSWMSMDNVASSIIDLMFVSDRLPQALNIVHPKPVSWTSVVEMVSVALWEERLTPEPLPLVPFHDWYTRLESLSKGSLSSNDTAIPALKLLSFFRSMSSADSEMRKTGSSNTEAGGIANFSVEKARSLSSSMDKAQPLNFDDVLSWVHYWNGAKFLR